MRPTTSDAWWMELIAALLVIVTMAYLEIHEDD